MKCVIIKIIMSTHVLITEYWDKIKCSGDLYLERENDENIAKMLNESKLAIDNAYKNLTSKARKREKQLPEPIKQEIELIRLQFNALRDVLNSFCNYATPDYTSLDALLVSNQPEYVPQKNMSKQINKKEAQKILNARIDQTKVPIEERAKNWSIMLTEASKGICYTYENHFQRCYAILLDISCSEKSLKFCPECKQFFIQQHGNTIYCSTKCKEKAKADRMKKKKKRNI